MSAYELNQAQAHALLLQRTGYQSAWTGLAKRLGLSALHDAKVAARTSGRKRARLAEQYREECEREAQTLADELPQTGTVMDVGCGLAGPDLALARLRPGLEFVLLDKDEFNDRPHYGFEDEASAYNSLDQTAAFLTSNGMPANRFRTVDVLSSGFPSDGELDAIISLMSWGFHYPVSTYLEQAHAILRPGGVLILDVRSGTDGGQEMARVFGKGQVRQVASPHTAFPRLLATK